MERQLLLLTWAGVIIGAATLLVAFAPEPRAWLCSKDIRSLCDPKDMKIDRISVSSQVIPERSYGGIVPEAVPGGVLRNTLFSQIYTDGTTRTPVECNSATDPLLKQWNEIANPAPSEVYAMATVDLSFPPSNRKLWFEVKIIFDSPSDPAFQSRAEEHIDALVLEHEGTCRLSFLLRPFDTSRLSTASWPSGNYGLHVDVAGDVRGHQDATFSIGTSRAATPHAGNPNATWSAALQQVKS